MWPTFDVTILKSITLVLGQNSWHFGTIGTLWQLDLQKIHRTLILDHIFYKFWNYIIADRAETVKKKQIQGNNWRVGWVANCPLIFWQKFIESSWFRVEHFTMILFHFENSLCIPIDPYVCSM